MFFRNEMKEKKGPPPVPNVIVKEQTRGKCKKI
jgi:hypothetical protein